MTKQQNRTGLYRAYAADGTLLYIGISWVPDARAEQHKSSSEWHSRMAKYTVDWFESRMDAVAAEAAAVRVEKPLYNSALQVRAPKSIKAIPYIPPTHTPPRQIRIDDRWYEFDDAAKGVGTTRAQLVNSFIAWYLRRPGAELPKRPTTPTD